MKHIVAGTAGHIDHGKTALVRALTGVDTDRLKEEKQRGISIDLGFAHLLLADDLLLGFVDVPGHERFIKNMLAGVGGIDLVLFVIAADESIKPQTREHFDICRLLHITNGIVVLTKCDLVDQDILELVRLEVDEFVRGSFLENAPVVAVSSTTGEGLVDLRAELDNIARAAAAKDASQHFRLPVDRAFSMRGFGTVVTGTLLAGAVRPEQEVQAYPSEQKFRVRGIQVHGAPAQKAVAGQRTALNLAGGDSSELSRGMTLAEPGRFEATRQVDCVFDLLASAKPLKHRAPVHFHAGAAVVEAEVRWLASTAAMRPGARAYARILLREPLLLLPGDRFIVRMFSPVTTIGGGIVLDNAAPRRAPLDRLKTLENGSEADRIALLVRESRCGIGMDALVARTGKRERDIAVAALSAKLVLIEEPQFWAMDPAWFAAKLDALHAALKAFHKEKTLAPGMSKEELRGRVVEGAPPFVLDALLRASKIIAADGDTVRLASHRVSLKQDEEDAKAKIEATFRDAGLAVPATLEVLAKSGVEAARARSLLQILLREKKLVRIGEDLVFHESAMLALREMLLARKGSRLSVGAFKDVTGVSRKYAIPLLEFLDRERVTRREGDERVVV